MRYTLLTTCLFLSHITHGQSEQEKSDLTPPAIYTYVEQLPEPGYDITNYLREHLNYPDNAANNNIQGRVILKFIVNEDGSTSDFQVLKSVGGGCDEEAIKVLRTMPKWKPGMHNGLPVRVWFTLPISFTLTEKEKIYTNASLQERPKADYDYEKYVAEHIQYPDSARSNKIQGEVYVTFVVNEDGSISNCVVGRLLGGGCDDEAKRVVKSMPNWKPGIHNGAPVKVREGTLVKFYLSEAEKIRIESEKVYTYVEQMPLASFDMLAYLSKNIEYPIEARKHNVTGRVIVKFVVTETGAIDNVHIVKGIGGGCDEEAIRVVSAMPKWKPGKQNGKPVKVYFTLPIVFKLTD